MTDRELLEDAAKAAGVDVFRYGNELAYAGPHGGFIVWNPLADDGDALRLAHTVPMIVTPGTARLLDGRLFGADNNDIAATRRAIVRAAAEIGKGLRPFPTEEEIREEWT